MNDRRREDAPTASNFSVHYEAQLGGSVGADGWPISSDHPANSGAPSQTPGAWQQSYTVGTRLPLGAARMHRDQKKKTPFRFHKPKTA